MMGRASAILIVDRYKRRCAKKYCRSQCNLFYQGAIIKYPNGTKKDD